MIAMPPTVITVAELPVEPDALQAFALEQNRCVKKEAVTAEDTSGDSKASRKLLAETFDAVYTALFERGATFLVTANATLRADDLSDGAPKKRT
ncbi:hypothetical protein CUJ87_08295 [Paraburkholderia caledonica]|jgi:hypothetical protein|nr:hypothetical protein CUJ87_08295 [Paraburkholderia caledonica]